MADDDVRLAVLARDDERRRRVDPARLRLAVGLVELVGGRVGLRVGERPVGVDAGGCATLRRKSSVA